MKVEGNLRRNRMMSFAGGVLGAALVLSGSGAWSQEAGASAKANTDSVETFYLTNVNEPHEANEVVTALRNLIDPGDKIFLLASQNAIVMRASPEELKLARKVLKDLDKPKKTYRLTYTINELEDGKRVGSQHYAIDVVSGGRTTFKNGNKVPVLTGSTDTGSTTSKTQFTYLDVGLNIDASLDESVDGVRLRSKMERSSVVEDRAAAGVNDPVIRQMVLEDTSILTPGKQATLGSLDVPGSTRHLEVEAIVEVVP